MAQAVIAER